MCPVAAVAVCPGGEFARAKLKTKSALVPGFLAVFGLMGLMSGAWLLTLYLMLGSLVLVGLTALGAERIIAPIARLGQLMPGVGRAGF